MFLFYRKKYIDEGLGYKVSVMCGNKLWQNVWDRFYKIRVMCGMNFLENIFTVS
jgi:hypothetical protein